MIQLPFSYNFENYIAVEQETKNFLLKNTAIETKLAETSWAVHSLGGVIPHTTENYWSGHYIPYSESFEEYQVSYLLCVQGFYKQAMASLRSVLETGMLSVYYNVDDDGHIVIQGWVQSKQERQYDTPRTKSIVKKLMKVPNVCKFQEKYDLFAEIDNVSFLSNYVHTKGASYSNKTRPFKSNTQTFEKVEFIKWLDTAHQIIKIISILHLLKYPFGMIDYDFSTKFGVDIPSFGSLNGFHRERIKNVLGDDIWNHLTAIAVDDESTTKFMAEIQNMPDVSQEEIDRQIEYIDNIVNKNRQ